jgi:hypothetical protein
MPWPRKKSYISCISILRDKPGIGLFIIVHHAFHLPMATQSNQMSPVDELEVKAQAALKPVNVISLGCIRLL